MKLTGQQGMEVIHLLVLAYPVVRNAGQAKSAILMTTMILAAVVLPLYGFGRLSSLWWFPLC